MVATEIEDARAAAAGTGNKDTYVRAMFTAIAPRYDLLNHVLSLNLDRGWRRRAINALEIPRKPGGRYLDLCAGTLDVSAAIMRRAGFSGTVVAADFSEGMLSSGRSKVDARVSPVTADAQVLPFASNSVAGAIVAFGIRNVSSLDTALREAWRVIEPGGRFVVLEFTTPPNALVRAGFHTYFHHVLPRIGRLVSGHKSAYSYLPMSVQEFPAPRALAARMEAAGFRDVTWQTVTLGVAAIHTATKP